MTPISSPVNTLVVGPGQYSFGDFVKVGVPFTIIVAIVSVLLGFDFPSIPLGDPSPAGNSTALHAVVRTNR